MEEQLECGRSDHSHGFKSTRQESFFYDPLVIMYWTLNSIYMQFE